MFHKKNVNVDISSVNSFNIQIASSKDIDENYQDYWYTREEALKKLRDGHILFLAKDNTTIKLYLWIDLLNIDIGWLNIKNLRIPSNVAYLATSYVPPEYQGRHIFKRALKFVSKYLSDNAIADTLFTITEPDTVSAGIIKLLGYMPYQKVLYFRIKGINLCFYIVESLESARLKQKRIFIQDSRFWNLFSSVLKEDLAGS
ncbi:MAG: hypothetical protein ABSB18_07245 [Candidatus Omnitrophota bacterium]